MFYDAPMKLFIIRHADPDYERRTITRAGHREARALAARMKRIGLDRIFCSPVPRAVHTMEYTARALRMKPVFLEWTRELSDLRTEQPPWGPLMAWDTPPEVLKSPDRRSPHRIDDIPALKGLPIAATVRRLRRESDAFLGRLGYRREGKRYRILRSNRKKIAVFCHGGFGLTWLSLLLEIPLPLMWGNFWLAPTSVTTLLFEERSRRWATPRAIGVCDVSHLDAAGLPISTHGLKANTA